MKQSKIRFLLAAIAIYPAVIMCTMWSVMCIFSLLRGDLGAIPYGFPFVSCLIIFYIFLKDTLKLYKEGK